MGEAVEVQAQPDGNLRAAADEERLRAAARIVSRGKSIGAAARELGVSEQGLRRDISSQEFQTALREEVESYVAPKVAEAERVEAEAIEEIKGMLALSLPTEADYTEGKGGATKTYKSVHEKQMEVMALKLKAIKQLNSIIAGLRKAKGYSTPVGAPGEPEEGGESGGGFTLERVRERVKVHGSGGAE